MGKTVDLKTITRQDLNEILRDLYGAVRNGKGDHYGISSYVCLRSALNRFINDPPLSRCWCLRCPSSFTSANNVFVGVVKTRRRQGHNKTKHHGSIPACDLATIKASLDPTDHTRGSSKKSLVRYTTALWTAREGGEPPVNHRVVRCFR